MNEPYATNRKMVKIMLLSAVTMGIYWVVTMMNIRRDLNKLAPNAPTTGSYIPVFLVPTAGIWPMIWMHKMSNKVGFALKERGLSYSFSCREFWLWFFLGSALSGAGPWVYTWKLCSAMNLLCADENARITGKSSPLVDKYKATQSNPYGAPVQNAAPQPQANGSAGQTTANAAAGERKVDIGAGFAALGKLLLESFKRPIGAAEEFFQNAKLGDSIVALGAVVVLYTAISFITGIVSVIYSAIRYGYASNAVGKIAGGLFFPVMYCAIMAGACFGLYCAINALFLKKEKNIEKLVAYGAACSAPLLLDSAATFLSRFLGIFGVPSGVRVVLWTVETVLGLLVLVIGLVNLKKVFEDERKYVAAIGIVMSGLTVASFIIAWIFRLMDWNFFTIPM